MMGKGEKMALELFRSTYKEVPAYKKFLKEHGIDGLKIKTITDWQKLPIIDKDSYLKKYPYRDLFPHGDITTATTISATSGSSGESFYFPRSHEHDRRHDFVFENFLVSQFEIKNKKSLVIIGFGMGIWIGGILNYQTFSQLAKKYSITIAPIGVNKELILKTIKKLGRYYEQIILCGYPPFIKDVADDALNYNVDWRDYKIKIINAAEGFSEKFRDYIAEKVGLANILTDNVNIYGTVEFGAMAHETALTILIRRIILDRPKLFQSLFGNAVRLPTLSQYYPRQIYFEKVDEEVIATGNGSSIPLIRYRFPDKGGVIEFEEMFNKFQDFKIDLRQEIKKNKIEKNIMKLPFVYVYERSDMAASLVGILIYPEYIKSALQHKKLSQLTTGKFTMSTQYDQQQNQFLEVRLELQKGIKEKESIASLAGDLIKNSLMAASTEYQHLYRGGSEKYKKQLEPVITLHAYEDSQYFKMAGKHKWLKK